MNSYRIYISGTFYGSAIARDEKHVLEMLDIEIKEKGKNGEPEGMIDHEWVWKQVQQKDVKVIVG